jgi:predicted Zn-dependent protease
LETSYDPRGAKYFFEKISAQGGSSIPEFLSTHPSPDNRVSNIEKVWQCLGSKQVVVPAPDSLYNAFKASLP